MSEKAQWQNRIVGYADVDPKTLAPNPQNYRRHPKRQGDAVTGSLNELGWIQDVLVNKTTGRMIDGHLRVELALQHGAQSVPVKYVELSEAEERLALATLDPLTYMAETDAAALGALLEGVNTGDAALQEMIAQLAEENGLFKPDPVQDVEPQIDRAEELRQKWGVESGDLWQLGDHRIICGDCTDADVVARVMGGERATLAPVDPPYNVGIDYDGETVNDNKGVEAYERFSRAWFGACQSVSDRQIVTPAFANLWAWMRFFDQPKHIGAWTKLNSGTRNGVSQFACFEPVLFFGDKFKRARHDDVFNFPVGAMNFGHPCPKPLAMWVDLVENYSEPGDVVYEAFSGSGTTIIACEQLGRKCRAVEISPGYVAVAIERWATATGRTPERIP